MPVPARNLFGLKWPRFRTENRAVFDQMVLVPDGNLKHIVSTACRPRVFRIALFEDFPNIPHIPLPPGHSAGTNEATMAPTPENPPCWQDPHRPREIWLIQGRFKEVGVMYVSSPLSFWMMSLKPPLWTAGTVFLPAMHHVLLHFTQLASCVLRQPHLTRQLHHAAVCCVHHQNLP